MNSGPQTKSPPGTPVVSRQSADPSESFIGRLRASSPMLAILVLGLHLLPWRPAEAAGRTRGFATPIEPVRVAGDLNGDGKVDVIDLLRLRDLAFRLGTIATAAENEAGDLTGDGKLDSLDVAALQDLVLRVDAAAESQSLRAGAAVHTGPNIANGTFEAGLMSWQVFRNNPANTVTTELDSEIPGNSVAHFNIQDASGSGWYLNLVQWSDQGPLNLQSATTYMIRFKARASSDRVLKLELAAFQPTYRNLGLLESVNLTMQTREYTVPFRTVDNVPATGVLFSMVSTQVAGDIWVDDVSIELVPLVTFVGNDTQIASFDGGESWDGGAIDTLQVREGDAGLRLTAATNGFQHVTREVPMDLSQTPWEMTFWVYTETPVSVGRLSLLWRSGSGEDAEGSYVAWALSGLASGWNFVVIPAEAFFKPYWYVNNFTWQGARTVAFKLEANGNGPASVTLDDLRIEPVSMSDRRSPVVSHINVVDVGPTSVTIRWLTQEPAVGALHYGANTAYGTTVTAGAPDTAQQVILTGLTPATRYHCRIAATDNAGLPGSSGDFTFATEPATPPFPPDSTLDFELGLYTVYGMTDLAGLAGMPFTHVHSFQFSRCTISMEAMQQYLDTAQDIGVKVMLGVSCNPIVEANSIPIVQAFKTHPATDSWYLYDEPEGHGISPAYLISAYSVIQAEDPTRPIVISSYAFGQPGFPYLLGFDRVLFDAYPVPIHPVDWLLPQLDAAGADGRPWGFVFQAFQWDVDRWIEHAGGPTRYPTAAEMRAMPFLAINRGAQHLWAFSYNDLNDLPGSEWKWSELLTLAQELKRLRPLFASTTAPTITATTSEPALDLATRRYGEREYVIAVNSSASSVSSSIALTGVTGVNAIRVGDGQTLPLNGGSLTDVWSPYDVRLYEVTPLDADDVSPTLAITEPPAGDYTSGATTVVVDANDDMLIDYVQVFVDGSPVGPPLTSAPYTMIWDAVQHSGGAHILSAVAYDVSNNYATTEIDVTVDNVAPSVVLAEPADGGVIFGTSIAVNATASDNDAVVGVQFTLDGNNLGAEDATAPYELTWDSASAPDGPHVLAAIARDRAGNSQQGIAAIVVDNTPPAAALTAPADGSVLVATPVPVNATATDARGIAGVQFLLDGAALGVPDTGSPYGVTWSNATDGPHVLTATAQDNTGHSTTTASVAVTVAIPPTVSLTAPAVGSVLFGTSVAVNATASDNDAIVGVQFTLDGANLGSEDTAEPYEMAWDCTSAPDGPHVLAALARDPAGHVSSQSVAIVVDNTPPAAAMTAPANGAVLVATSVPVSASATDARGIAGVQFLLDGAALGAIDTGSPYSVTWSNPTDGPHVLTATAQDNTGHSTTTAGVSVTVAIPPTVAVTAPANGSVLFGTSVAVNATASDNDAIVGVQFTLDGANLGPEDTTAPYQLTWNSTSAPDGPHVLAALARDPAGHVSSQSVAIVVDNTPPAAAMTAPANGALLAGTSIPVSATATDARGIAGVQFLLDGANLGARDTQSPYSVTWSNPIDGSHVLTATAQDNTGHFTTATSVAVIVDNTPPPAPGAVRDGTGADLQFTNVSTQLSANWNAVTDPGSGVNHYRMAIGTSAGGAQVMAFTNIGNVTVYTKTGLNLSNGTRYFVSIRAVDNAGRVGAVRTSDGIRVDTTAPTVSVTKPNNNATVKGTAVAVQASASDTYGIASVQFTLDGVNLGSVDTSSPYSIVWNTTTTSNGIHYLRAVATDQAGNVKTSNQVKVTVNN